MAAFPPPTGRRLVLQNCTLGELEIDPAYQRSIQGQVSQAHIRALARDWNWSLCLPLVVARRVGADSQERLFVVDGQHRLAAARLRGDIYDLPCVVGSYADTTAEAAAFVALNARRRTLGPLDLFRAAVASGDDQAAVMQRLITDAGLALAPHTNRASWTPGVIDTVSGVRRILREHGEDVTGRSLAVLAGAFAGQVLHYAGTLLPGIAAALADPPRGADDDLLVMILAEDGQEAWAQRINQLRARLSTQTRRASEIAIAEAYAEVATELADEEAA